MLREKRRYVLLLILIMALMLFVMGFASGTFTAHRWMLGKYVSETEAMQLIQGKEQIRAPGDPALSFKGEDVPYDYSQSLIYIPQNCNTEGWEGSFTSDKYEILIPDDPYWEYKDEAIRQSHHFKMYLADEMSYFKLDLVITGTPVVVIDDEFENNGDRYYHFTIFDPGDEDRNYTVETSYCEFRIRGQSSARKDKPGYRINLYNDSLSDDRYLSLLGMDSSRKWNLRPLYTDDTEVREKTASEIWNLMNQKTDNPTTVGTQQEYVELVWNRSYMGVFLMMRPIDYEIQGLAGNDVLYKVNSWSKPTRKQMSEIIEEGLVDFEGILIKYPKAKDIDNYTDVWAPYDEWLEAF